MARYGRILRQLWLVLALAPLPAWGGQAFIYVTNSAGDSIHVIDPATNKVVQQIKGIEAAHGIAPSPDGARVYVSNEADSTLDVIDAKTLTRTKSILVKGRLHNIYVTPDGKHLITGSIPGKLLTVIDLEREVPIWELPFDLGVRPMTIEAGADSSTKRIFVQLSDTNGFAVVDFVARKEVARIKLPATTAEFETDAGRATAPSHGIGVAPDGKTLWVTSIPNNAVFVYALPEIKLVGEVALPALKLAGHGPIASVPNWVTFTPDSKTIYISNAAIKSVTAIDTEDMKVKAVVPVGEVPKRITTLVMK